MITWIKRNLANWVLKDLFCAVGIANIMTIDEKHGIIYLGGEKADPALVKSLAQEALFIRKSQLWGIISDTLKEQARMTMFKNSKTWEDMIAGKMMLYSIDVQEKIIKLVIDNGK